MNHRHGPCFNRKRIIMEPTMIQLSYFLIFAFNANSQYTYCLAYGNDICLSSQMFEHKFEHTILLQICLS